MEGNPPTRDNSRSPPYKQALIEREYLDLLKKADKFRETTTTTTNKTNLPFCLNLQLKRPVEYIIHRQRPNVCFLI